MDQFQAAKYAKTHVEKLFADEKIGGIALEGIEYNSGSARWLVTLSFQRFDAGSPTALLLGGRRVFKRLEFKDEHDASPSLMAVAPPI